MSLGGWPSTSHGVSESSTFSRWADEKTLPLRSCAVSCPSHLVSHADCLLLTRAPRQSPGGPAQDAWQHRGLVTTLDGATPSHSPSQVTQGVYASTSNTFPSPFRLSPYFSRSWAGSRALRSRLCGDILGLGPSTLYSFFPRY